LRLVVNRIDEQNALEQVSRISDLSSILKRFLNHPRMQ